MDVLNKKHRYSFIYSMLVSQDDDFVGLVAYSIYKKEKIAHVKAFQEKHGRDPEPTELENFHSSARNRIDQYKELAEHRVANFGEIIYSEKLESLETQYDLRIKEEIAKISPSWWKGVFQSIVGSFIYTISIGLVVMAILCAQHGLSWIFEKTMTTISAPN